MPIKFTPFLFIFINRLNGILRLWNYNFIHNGRLATFRLLVFVLPLSGFFPVFAVCFEKNFLFTSLWKKVLVVFLRKNTSHRIFFNAIVQTLVLFMSMVLEGTFSFTINVFKELEGLRWLVCLIIHGYFRHEVTTSILLLLLCLLLWLLHLVTWFEENVNFFLFGASLFQLFIKDNQKIIRWLWRGTETIAYHISSITKK